MVVVIEYRLCVDLYKITLNKVLGKQQHTQYTTYYYKYNMLML